MKKDGKGGLLKIVLAVLMAWFALRMLRILWRFGMIALTPLAAMAALFVSLAFLWLIWRKK